MDLTSFVAGHSAIRRTLHRLDQYVDADVDAHASDLSALLNETRARIQLHLAIEDRFLYPQLDASRNPRMNDIAAQFRDEMGALGSRYDAFVDHFGSIAAIRAAPAAFLSEARAVYRALADRVEREEAELYPLAGML